MIVKQSLNEYAYEDDKHGDILTYYLPSIMWRDIRHGYTDAEQADWFIQFDGIANARFEDDEILKVYAQEKGMTDWLMNDFEMYELDDYIHDELSEYVGADVNELNPIDLANLLRVKHTSDAVLEAYGLSYIFALNEDESTNIFQKFKEPLAKAITKVKNKFGERPCKVISDIVKKASAKGRKTLYGVLTAVTLLSGTLSAGATTTSDFDVNLRDSVVKSTVSMGKAQGLQSETEWNRAKEQAVSNFTDILYTLEIDSENRYGACGVGCSESLSQAQQLAQQDVEKTLKEKYGENAIKEYGIKFKTVQNKSYT